MLRKVLVVINLLLIFGMLLGWLSTRVSPESLWPLAFAGLGFPFLVLFNFLFLIAWFFLHRRNMWIPLAAILILFPLHWKTCTISIPSSTKDSIKVMSWNVKNFDLYNWSNNMQAREEMFDLILEEDPDILCLQEFYNETIDRYDNLEQIRERLGYEHWYFTPSLKYDEISFFGIITFSKFPIVDTGRIEFSNATQNLATWVDLDVEGEKLRVYNMHLAIDQTRLR